MLEFVDKKLTIVQYVPRGPSVLKSGLTHEGVMVTYEAKEIIKSRRAIDSDAL